ncbi:MAG TPA: hypothetical protein VGP64_03755 [Polyangia bacterium]
MLAAALALGAAACVSGFDRNDQTVNSLRILGASMHVDNGDGIDWADAQAGDTVTFKALVANPTGIPDVTVTWVTCVPPDLNNTLTPCTNETTLRDPIQLIGMPGVLMLGQAMPSADEATVQIQFTVPPEVKALTQQLIDRADMHVNAQCALYLPVPVIIIAQGNGGTTVVTAVKNLRLSPWSQIGPTDPTDSSLQAYVRNFNPSISALNIPNDHSACVGQTLVQSCKTDTDCTNGGPCSADGWCPPVNPFPAGAETICGQIPDTDTQTYYYCGMDGVDGSEMEYPSITWYETAGSEADVANTNTTGTPDLAARTFQLFTRPTGPFTLYGVVRDGRDGENWIAQTFPALP